MTEYTNTEATLSGDRMYRYRLVREWVESPLRPATFIMFNPSTADAKLDDPTIRRCVGFAQAWGCDALKVVNLFAFRAASPRDLLAAADPVGVHNDSYLRLSIQVATAQRAPLVAAWGALADTELGEQRVAWLRKELDYQQAEAQCLNTTKSGAPCHPLYQRADCELRGWPA